MMDRKNQLWFLFQFLREVEKGLSKEEEKQVMIEKAINLKRMCDYAVSCSYGDIVLIICMLHDYVKTLDELRADDIQYQAYYRKKFMNMADRLAGQIEYDYDQAVEKCGKKQQKQENHGDIGEDGLSQFIRRGAKTSKKAEKEQSLKEIRAEIEIKYNDGLVKESKEVKGKRRQEAKEKRTQQLEEIRQQRIKEEQEKFVQLSIFDMIDQQK